MEIERSRPTVSDKKKINSVLLIMPFILYKEGILKTLLFPCLFFSRIRLIIFSQIVPNILNFISLIFRKNFLKIRLKYKFSHN